MEFKGTKGEWKIDGKSIKCGIESIASVWSMKSDDLDERLEGESWLSMRKRTEIERNNRTESIPNANAHLIAAAPELLEALIQLTSNGGLMKLVSENKNTLLYDRYSQAQQAINKALGL